MTLTTQKILPISIIIPTLNEEGNLNSLLSSIQAYKGVEIIVVDGGSTDRTVDIARKFDVTLIHSKSGRGVQQNQGAINATGEILIFLHCDTILPNRFPEHVHSVLADPEIAIGSFQLQIDAQEIAYRVIEWGANIRARYFGFPYGDQALFMRKNTFFTIGGFPELPLLEDIEMVRRTKKVGRVHIAPAAVVTSGRRWKRLGIFRTTLVNQIILIGYLAGIAPAKLAKLYKDFPA